MVMQLSHGHYHVGNEWQYYYKDQNNLYRVSWSEILVRLFQFLEEEEQTRRSECRQKVGFFTKIKIFYAMGHQIKL